MGDIGRRLTVGEFPVLPSRGFVGLLCVPFGATQWGWMGPGTFSAVLRVSPLSPSRGIVYDLFCQGIA